MKRSICAIVVGGICLLSVAGSAGAASSYGSDPSTAAQIARLREADRADRMNAQSWTSTNASLDHYYDRKSEQVEDVLKQIEIGQPVSPETVSRALDNSGASSY